MQTAYALANYLNPGNELFIETKSPVLGVTQYDIVSSKCHLGYTPLLEAFEAANTFVGLRASERWSELDEGPVVRHRRGTVGTRGWRNRGFRGLDIFN